MGGRGPPPLLPATGRSRLCFGTCCEPSLSTALPKTKTGGSTTTRSKSSAQNDPTRSSESLSLLLRSGVGGQLLLLLFRLGSPPSVPPPWPGKALPSLLLSLPLLQVLPLLQLPLLLALQKLPLRFLPPELLCRTSPPTPAVRRADESSLSESVSGVEVAAAERASRRSPSPKTNDCGCCLQGWRRNCERELSTNPRRHESTPLANSVPKDLVKGAERVGDETTLLVLAPSAAAPRFCSPLSSPFDCDQAGEDQFLCF